MKKVSLKGLADFMTASPVRQRKIVREYKYPSQEESRAKTLYYKEARAIIVSFHKRKINRTWLAAKASELETAAGSYSGRSRTRLLHNARAVRDYNRNFGTMDYDVLNPLVMELQYGDVFVTVVPDLHVRENGVEKIIKLEFTKKEPGDGIVKIFTQALFEAVRGQRILIAAKDVLYEDVGRGKAFKGARMGSRMTNNIEAACNNISDIWDKISP